MISKREDAQYRNDSAHHRQSMQQGSTSNLAPAAFHSQTPTNQAPGHSREVASNSATSPVIHTIAWVGPEAEEFNEPFQFCSKHARQMAVRDSIEDLIANPPDNLDRIVYCKRTREVEPRDWSDLPSLFPSCKTHILYGSECEGEARTGTPWSACQNLAWHAWNQEIPFWFYPRRPAKGSTANPLVVVGVTRSTDLADALQTLVAHNGHTAHWTTSPSSSAIRNVDVVIWDDTSAPATDRHQWKQRLACFRKTPLSHASTTRHIWCAGFPRYAEWLEAKQGGCDCLISKPCGEAVFSFVIDRFANESLSQYRTHVKPLATVTSHPIG